MSDFVKIILSRLIGAYLLINILRSIYVVYVHPSLRICVNSYIIPLIYKFNGVVYLNRAGGNIKVDGLISYEVIDNNIDKINTMEKARCTISGDIPYNSLTKRDSPIEIEEILVSKNGDIGGSKAIRVNVSYGFVNNKNTDELEGIFVGYDEDLGMIEGKFTGKIINKCLGEIGCKLTGKLFDKDTGIAWGHFTCNAEGRICGSDKTTNEIPYVYIRFDGKVDHQNTVLNLTEKIEYMSSIPEYDYKKINENNIDYGYNKVLENLKVKYILLKTKDISGSKEGKISAKICNKCIDINRSNREISIDVNKRVQRLAWLVLFLLSVISIPFIYLSYSPQHIIIDPPEISGNLTGGEKLVKTISIKSIGTNLTNLNIIDPSCKWLTLSNSELGLSDQMCLFNVTLDASTNETDDPGEYRVVIKIKADDELIGIIPVTLNVAKSKVSTS